MPEDERGPIGFSQESSSGITVIGAPVRVYFSAHPLGGVAAVIGGAMFRKQDLLALAGVLDYREEVAHRPVA